jgi:hypothetical protein
MPRKKLTPDHLPLPKSPLPFSKFAEGTVKDWIRHIALQGSWSDVCAAIFLEWYPVWEQGPQAQKLNWAQFRRQVEEGARRFWFLDPMQVGRRGRPSVADQCFKAIEDYIALQEVHIPRKSPPPTQGDYIRAIRKRFPKLKKETWRKHARLWQLLNDKKPSEFSSGDWKFLKQHRPEDFARYRFTLLSSETRSEALKEMMKAIEKMNNLPF